MSTGNAVEACHVACGIIDNRYGEPLTVGVPTLLADDFFHASFVLGPGSRSWRNLDLADLGKEEMEPLIGNGLGMILRRETRDGTTPTFSL